MNKPMQLFVIILLLGLLYGLLQTPQLATVIGTSGQRLSNFTAPSSVIVNRDTAKVLTLACYAPNGVLLGHNSPEPDETKWLDDHHFMLKSAEKVDYLNEIVGDLACSYAGANGKISAVFFIYER